MKQMTPAGFRVKFSRSASLRPLRPFRPRQSLSGFRSGLVLFQEPGTSGKSLAILLSKVI